MSLFFSLLLILALLCDNKEPSAVCQQKFRRVLTLKYLHGLNAFKDENFKDCGKASSLCSS